MRRPSMVQLPAHLAHATREVATVLARAGHRAWLVGGAVRDLALELEPHDADLASAATPDEVMALFAHTHAVGKAFGTVVVHRPEVDLELTTFRAETGYDDARHPTHVRFTTELAEDASRRDFTCNALYLDPLNDELSDPTDGLVDLRAGVLRCVGDPLQRFGEDGLRLVRLVRLAAQYGLEIDAATEAGARRTLRSLRGVSPERVLIELRRMAEGAAPARAASLLVSLGLWGELPALGELDRPPARAAAVARLGECSEARFLAVLLGPARGAEVQDRLDALAALRPPRELVRRVQRILELAQAIDACLEALEARALRPSQWIRLVRREEFADALACWTAWSPDLHVEARERLAELAAGAPRTQLWPEPLVTSAELERAGIPRGARWRSLLEEGEGLQLDGVLTHREEARAWLAREARTGGASGGREDAP